jgi:flap endonuclease-1
MGIKSINDVFHTYAPSAFTLLPVLSFNGYRIAFDGCNWAYQYMAAVIREYVYKMPDPLQELDRGKLIEMLIAKGFEFNSSQMEMGVLPVWAWDGEPYPEKGAEHEKRASARHKQLEELESMANEIRTMHPLQRTPDVLKEYKKKKSLLVSVRSEEMVLLKQAFACAGLPCIQAPHEGESLCAQLCREGICKATWTTDTDAYPNGNTIMVTGFETGPGNQPCFKAVLVYQFPAALGFTQEQITDMCILAGCDWNTNIYRIGSKTAYKKILKYGSIEGMRQAETQHNYDVLNYERCREIFKVGSSGLKATDAAVNFNYEFLGTMGRELFRQYNLDGYFERFLNATKYIPKDLKTVNVEVLFANNPTTLRETILVIESDELQLEIESDESPVSPNDTLPMLNIDYSQPLSQQQELQMIANQLQQLQGLHITNPIPQIIKVPTPPPINLLPIVPQRLTTVPMTPLRLVAVNSPTEVKTVTPPPTIPAVTAPGFNILTPIGFKTLTPPPVNLIPTTSTLTPPQVKVPSPPVGGYPNKVIMQMPHQLLHPPSPIVKVNYLPPVIPGVIDYNQNQGYNHMPTMTQLVVE